MSSVVLPPRDFSYWSSGGEMDRIPTMPEGPVVQQMFARVAGRYDLANRLLSAGVDRRWRKIAVQMAEVRPEDRVLDVCAGTGDLSFDLARAGAAVVGSDFTFEMLEKAQAKIPRAWQAPGSAAAGRPVPPVFIAGDTMELPFPDHAFDLVTVAFGIRNVQDPLAGLTEMRRVIRPGGRVVVLEFCKPSAPIISGLYLFYFRRILPILGRLISGDTGGAYSYLPASVMAFPERAEFLELMTKAGFGSPQQKILTCGIAALYRAEVEV